MRCLTTLMLLGVLSACSSFNDVVPPEALIRKATLATETDTDKRLFSLPPAKQPVVVSVYEFSDLTGQNKPGETPQYSKAVTQGGIPILKKALLDAANHGWFRVLERGGLNNLLQERKIIRAMRDEFNGPDGKPLPALGPMLYAGVLLEGGIVAYESNVMTGGIGAQYLGIGASTKYSRDVVTVYLRATSVETGEVLVSVNTSKTIFSKSLSGGLFAFVSYDRIAEGEAGVTYNEPPQLAVREAIEMSVYALIMEGYRQKLWEFADSTQGESAYRTYRVASSAEHIQPVSTAVAGQVPQIRQEEVPVRNEQTARTEAAGRTVSQASQAEDRLALATPAPTPCPPEMFHPSAAEIKPNKPSDFVKGWYILALSTRYFGPQELSEIEKMREIGIPYKVQEASSAHFPYYRVLIGAFSSWGEADQARNDLRLLLSKGSARGVRAAYPIEQM